MSIKLLEECFDTARGHLETADRWKNSKYECIKTASTTAKGKFGEVFTTTLLNGIGIESTVVNGGKGDFDIELTDLGITFEHKLATIDTNDYFQINAIDKNKNYDYVFCLGITPNKMVFDIIPKSWLKKHLTTNMTKAKGGYKLMRRLDSMIELTEINLRNKLEELNIGRKLNFTTILS